MSSSISFSKKLSKGSAYNNDSRIYDEVKDLKRLLQQHAYRSELPKLSNVSTKKPSKNSHYKSCVQLKIIVPSNQNQIKPIKGYINSAELEFVVRIPCNYPLERPDIVCVAGAENLPSTFIRNGMLFLPWLERGWPHQYSLISLVNDMCFNCNFNQNPAPMSNTSYSYEAFTPQSYLPFSTVDPSPRSELSYVPTAPTLIKFDESQPLLPTSGILSGLSFEAFTPQSYLLLSTVDPSPRRELGYVPTAPTLIKFDESQPPVPTSAPRVKSPEPDLKEDRRKSQITVKCVWLKQIRRFLVGYDCDYSKLYTLIKKICVIPSDVEILIQYIDRDQDKCIVSTNEELRGAIHDAGSISNTLKLQIDEKRKGKTERAASADKQGDLSDSPISGIRVVDIKDIKIQDCIGDGSSCKVYKGIWRGTEDTQTRLTIVDPIAMKNEFHQEVSMMKRLGSHPSIVLLLAVCHKPLCLVFEFLPLSLFDLINNCPNSSTKPQQFLSNWKKRISMMLDIARGLQFLHSFEVIHRDLKSLNLLVTESGKIKLAGLNEFKRAALSILLTSDFGIARVTDSKNKMTGCMGTTQWMAPEVIVSQSYSISADVYSFGIIMWEICEVSAPFKDMAPAQVAISVINQQYRPTISPNVPTPLQGLIKKCWDQKAQARPTAEQVVTYLVKCHNACQ